MTETAAAAGRSGVFVVVPAFNEERTIRAVIDELIKTYPNVVVVDDGSTDATGAALVGSGVHVLTHALNRGQGAALQTGIEYALARGAQVVVTCDSDGQHRAEDIAPLIAPVLAGECDVALGSRFLGSTEHMPLTRGLLLRGGVVFTRLVSHIRVTDVHNGMRALSRHAAQTIHITMDRMAHASEILDQIHAKGLSHREVPVTIRYSEYSLEKGQRSSNAIRIALQVILDKLR